MFFIDQLQDNYNMSTEEIEDLIQEDRRKRFGKKMQDNINAMERGEDERE